MASDIHLERVLIIDDDQDILTIAKYALELGGPIEVKCLLSSEEALNTALAFRPDLILLDVMMPKVDGLATLKVLRAHAQMQHIPVILFSAKALSNELDFYRTVGAQGIIIKPFDPTALISQVLEIWKKEAGIHGNEKTK